MTNTSSIAIKSVGKHSCGGQRIPVLCTGRDTEYTVYNQDLRGDLRIIWYMAPQQLGVLHSIDVVHIRHYLRSGG